MEAHHVSFQRDRDQRRRKLAAGQPETYRLHPIKQLELFLVFQMDQTADSGNPMIARLELLFFAESI
jgi:hypothetical protein